MYESGAVLGRVAPSRVPDRCAYAGAVGHSVQVHPAARGRGVASALLKALVGSTEAAGIWTVQSGTFPGNTASPALHERAGSSASGSESRAVTESGVTSCSPSAAATSSPDPPAGPPLPPPGTGRLPLGRRSPGMAVLARENRAGSPFACSAAR